MKIENLEKMLNFHEIDPIEYKDILENSAKHQLSTVVIIKNDGVIKASLVDYDFDVALEESKCSNCQKCSCCMPSQYGGCDLKYYNKDILDCDFATTGVEIINNFHKRKGVMECKNFVSSNK